MAKLFSIVICVHNGQKYLNRVIDSLEKLKESDKLLDAILFVDNASSDNTADIIKQRMQNNSLIRYSFEEKLGLSEARKHAVYLESEWIIYFDDDNLPNENWLMEIEKSIMCNPKVGVLGGQNIARVEDDITEEEKINLYAIPGSLACHFAHMDEYMSGRRSTCEGAIFGAGMVVLRKILCHFLEEGWSLNSGRQGENLGAYEDTEIVNYAQKIGYEIGICKTAYLEHIIPLTRLSEQYLKRLRYEMDICYFRYIRSKTNGVTERRGLFFKAFLQYVYYQCKFLFSHDKVLKKRYKFLIISDVDNIKLFFQGV